MTDNIAKCIVSGIATAAFALAGCVSAKSPADITEVNPVPAPSIRQKVDVEKVPISPPVPEQPQIQPGPEKVAEIKVKPDLKSGEYDLEQTIRIINELRDNNVLLRTEADELILRAVRRVKREGE